MPLKRIRLSADGSFTAWDMDGNFVWSPPGQTIWDSLRTLALGLQAPWMSLEDAYRQAAVAHNVRLTFDGSGRPQTVVALPDRD
ncbi:MAG: hypothetical protein H6712_17800 [Myxococcales bacterium]|nr:hypothetical protein [Myxococcales bacterium]MCB9715729.1 hypothetical protein [Myxococcales bacterium]